MRSFWHLPFDLWSRVTAGPIFFLIKFSCKHKQEKSGGGDSDHPEWADREQNLPHPWKESHARPRPCGALRSWDTTAQSGCKKKFRPLPARVYVSAHKRRNGKLEITICDIQSGTYGLTEATERVSKQTNVRVLLILQNAISREKYRVDVFFT